MTSRLTVPYIDGLGVNVTMGCADPGNWYSERWPAFFDRLRSFVHKEITVDSTENERLIRLADIDSRKSCKESHQGSTSPHSVENILRVSAGDSLPIKSGHYYRLTFLEIIIVGSVISTTEHIYPYLHP